MPDDSMSSMLSPVSGPGAQAMLFALLGSPMGEAPSRLPAGVDVQSLFESAFENGVALMMLERCEALGVPLTESMRWERKRLQERRRKTDAVAARLSSTLNRIAEGQWTLFKSMKPFSSAHNNTDWIPFEPERYEELCDHLIENGFRLLETAPLRMTLVEASGLAASHGDQRGQVNCVDCYKMPAADYLVYLDPAKLRDHTEIIEIDGVPTPTLVPTLELLTIMVHSVLSEQTYTIETFYLIMHHLAAIERQGWREELLTAIADNCCTRAASANIAVTAALHRRHFGFVPEPLQALLTRFQSGVTEGKRFALGDMPLPYEFSGSCFWMVFLEKLRDRISLKSAFLQIAHMMNPFFFFDVMRMIWKRTRAGDIFKNMDLPEDRSPRARVRRRPAATRDRPCRAEIPVTGPAGPVYAQPGSGDESRSRTA